MSQPNCRKGGSAQEALADRSVTFQVNQQIAVKTHLDALVDAGPTAPGTNGASRVACVQAARTPVRNVIGFSFSTETNGAALVDKRAVARTAVSAAETEATTSRAVFWLFHG